MGDILEYRVVESTPSDNSHKIHTLAGQVTGQVWAENLAATLRAGGSRATVEHRVYGSDRWHPDQP